MKIGIDLTWLKPKISGGIESFAHNLLEGFTLVDSHNNFILFLSKDNANYFNKYIEKENFKSYICPCLSSKIGQRILWQNLFFNKILKQQNIDICFTPFYNKPLLKCKGIKTITVIHDLQALHYPEYFSSLKYNWLRFAWKRTLITSDKIVAISNFVKNDIIDKYGIKFKNKIQVIYNPIKITQQNNILFPNKVPYYYTICSKFRHKNFKTLILLMEKIKKDYPQLPHLLYVTGMASFPTEIEQLINQKGLKENIKLTGFISNSERDKLIQGAEYFLFPSLFEGFGMPVIESLMLGTPVITTKTTSIPEVSCNKAIYVDNPTDVNEWINAIVKNKPIKKRIEFPQYSVTHIAKQYIDLFKKL